VTIGSAVGVNMPQRVVHRDRRRGRRYVVDRSKAVAVVVIEGLRSQAGTTCCGSRPTAKCSTIRYVCGSITSTVLLWLLGT
jgi:hypothetical protein